MKFRILCVSVCMSVLPMTGWATPPESLEAFYNPDQQLLSVAGRHPTQDRHEHFIRRIKVTINHNEPITKYLAYQSSAKEFRAQMVVNGKPGDMIKVEAFCSQGGSKEFVLQIPQEVVVEPAPVDHAVELKSMKDNDHSTLPIIP